MQIVTPSAPGGLTANVDESGAVSLHWAVTSPNENGFMIERALDNAFTTGEAEFHVAAGTTSFTDITVIPGKTFFYRVLAVTGVGHSDPVERRLRDRESSGACRTDHDSGHTCHTHNTDHSCHTAGNPNHTGNPHSYPFGWNVGCGLDNRRHRWRGHHCNGGDALDTQKSEIT